MTHISRFHFKPATGIAAALLLFAGSVSADVKVYDTTLASPNTHAADTSTNPSWYNGTGNQTLQGGWTVDQNSNIELGLRAKIRNGAVIDSPGSDDYYVLSGFQPATTRATWNYEFSINLRPGGVGSLTLSDVRVSLKITDVNTGGTATVNPFTYWADNSGFGTGAGGAGGMTIANRDLPAVGGDWGLQNSENATFADFPLAGFDPNANHTYAFDLTVTDGAGALLAQDHMDVIVTPEPSALILFGTAAFGAWFTRRRRSKTSA